MTVVKNKRARCSHRNNKRLPLGASGGIQLILVNAVDSLGKAGDIVEVKRGYANNFLLPQGLATTVTEHHKRQIEKHRLRLAEEHRKELERLKKLAEEIKLKRVTIEAKANEEGHLYGSVGPEEIVKGLREEKMVLTPDKVKLAGPIKELALYTVKIDLGYGIESELKVWVVPAVKGK